MAEKIKFSDWLLARALESNAQLRDNLDSSKKHPYRDQVAAMFEKLGNKISDEKLATFREQLALMNPDLGAAIADLRASDFVTDMPAIPFSVIAMGANPSEHNYGTSYFLAIRPSAGFKVDGKAGNCFPSYEAGKWKIADDTKVKEVVEKMVSAAKDKTTEFSEYVAAIKTFADVIVDFSEVM